ncbi:MAG: protein tyrosine phosphatase family protein [Desulfobacterales bacterium]|nr:protein tyrosine phosphatase family protein [Desulfobacterales bacterium]
MRNTIKSVIQYYWSVILRKYTIVKPKTQSVEDILNYLRYENGMISSGQPARNQFNLIRDAGYSVVINLAAFNKKGISLKDEKSIVTGLGMRYFHIPVDFMNPTNQDFHKFIQVMDQVKGERIWIHCDANARASAFIYRYRCAVLGEDHETAIWDLREIWEPFGIWKRFTYADFQKQAVSTQDATQKFG